MFDLKLVKWAIADMLRRGRPFDLLQQMGIMAEHFNHLKSPTNRTRAPSSPRIGNYTAFLRRKHLGLFIHMLRACGFKPKYLTQLRAKHVKEVVKKWDTQKLATRTIQTRLAAIRALFSWLGLEHELPPNRELLPPQRWRTPGVAQHDKTWVGNGWDVFEIVTWIPVTHLWIRLCLLLQKEFGLRMKEACLLRPWEADNGHELIIERGPKGGRRRGVAIETDAQCKLLHQIKAHVRVGDAVIGPIDAISWITARRRYYRMMHRTLQFTKANTGVVLHGLRAEYACALYKKRTGELPPIQGGRPVAREFDIATRKEIAARLGHNRYSVTSAYLGRMRRQRRKPATAV